ncbi:MAG: hypothetical protein K8T25_18425 [Planctomycetia bacterium]|nr:hypothetical protein [Planctomycetia bacterium]
MTQPTLNPYASPATEPPTLPFQPRVSNGELRPLWTWLTIALLISAFVAPADPFSMLLSLAYGLLCFWAGCIAGSRTNVIVRIAVLILWLIAAIAIDVSIRQTFAAIAAFYGLASIVCGAWAFRRLGEGRLRILALFSAGYFLGSVLGPLGTAGGSVLGALVARKLVRQNQSLAKPGADD